MPTTVTALTPPVTAGLFPGEGFKALVQVAWDNSFAVAGEVMDLSGIFPNEVYGAAVYADTLNDGGYECTYTRAALGAPATGVVQAWWTNNDAGGAQDPLIIVTATTDVSAMNGQRWMCWGR